MRRRVQKRTRTLIPAASIDRRHSWRVSSDFDRTTDALLSRCRCNISVFPRQVIIISLTELNQNIPLAQSNPFVVGFVGNSAVVRSPTFFSTYTVVYSPLAQPSFLCALGAADCIVCLFYEGENVVVVGRTTVCNRD